MKTFPHQSCIGVIIIIKPASFNLLRSIAAGLGSQLTLYFIVVILLWSSHQITFCECNPFDYLVIGLGHWPIITCASPSLLTSPLDARIRVRSVPIRVRIFFHCFGLNCSKSSLQVPYFLVPITVIADLLLPFVGLLGQLLAEVIYFDFILLPTFPIPSIGILNTILPGNKICKGNHFRRNYI